MLNFAKKIITWSQIPPCWRWWRHPPPRAALSPPPESAPSSCACPPARSSQSPRRRHRTDCRGTRPPSANQSRTGTSGCTRNTWMKKNDSKLQKCHQYIKIVVPGNEREPHGEGGLLYTWKWEGGNHMARVGCSIPGDEREPHGEGGLLYTWWWEGTTWRGWAARPWWGCAGPPPGTRRSTRTQPALPPAPHQIMYSTLLEWELYEPTKKLHLIFSIFKKWINRKHDTIRDSCQYCSMPGK